MILTTALKKLLTICSLALIISQLLIINLAPRPGAQTHLESADHNAIQLTPVYTPAVKRLEKIH